MADFSGAYAEILTPLNRSGEVDTEAFYEHATELSENGIEGLVVMGKAGEGRHLDNLHAMQLYAPLTDLRSDGMKVIWAAIKDDEDSLLRQVIEGNGVCDAMLIAPVCNAESDEDDLIRLLDDVKALTKVPLLVYNIPHVTGFEFTPKFLSRLNEEVEIMGVVDCCNCSSLLNKIAHKYIWGEGEVMSFEYIPGYDPNLLHALQQMKSLQRHKTHIKEKTTLTEDQIREIKKKVGKKGYDIARSFDKKVDVYEHSLCYVSAFSNIPNIARAIHKMYDLAMRGNDMHANNVQKELNVKLHIAMSIAEDYDGLQPVLKAMMHDYDGNYPMAVGKDLGDATYRAMEPSGPDYKAIRKVVRSIE